jgi:thiamine-monophosphate kinase
LKEFDFINSMLKPLAGKNSFGLNDDCAHFDGFVVTKDILTAGVHFFADDAPYDLARKALRVNLSDIASCGAKPFGFLIAVTLPKNTPEKWLREFTRGLKADITKYKFQLLGGDTTTHNGPLVISVTALGKTKKPITRTGAKVGDNIFVSGKIGEGFIGLQTRSGKYLLPNPRIELGQKLRGKASACIDISDGLLADLNHICKASGVGAEVFSSQIPIPKSKYKLHELITGGDDYELCFTSKLPSFPGCTKIGKIVKGSGIKLDGKKVEPKGYEHKA